MSIKSTLTLNASVLATNDVDLGTTRAQRAVTLSQVLTNGTGAGSADLVFADTRTVTASGNEDLDLSGSLTDAFGVAQVFARVKAIAVQAAAANTNNVVITRPASGAPLFLASGDGVSLRPGETFSMICGSADATGHAVTAGSADLINIANSGGSTSVTYSIIVVGASA